MIVPARAAAAFPAWTTYRHDAARSGIDPDSASPVTPSAAWQTGALDGEVYAQPLVYGPYVYVATENDTMYKLSASSGAVVWWRNLATPEPDSAAPCGDVSPLIGITSTPVIDPASNRIYAVGAVSASGQIHHELFALDLSSGQPAAGFPITVDPPFPTGGAPENQLQRAGLALDGGRILIGYGGNDGDCATYWGWLVSAPESGAGGLTSFQVDPNNLAGAIWAAGNAPPIDAGGNVFVATGNGIGNSGPNPDYGDSVVRLNASASPLDWWAPLNWQSLDSADADLGSSMPTLLPGGFLFVAGKDDNGYVVNGAALGHVHAPLAEASGFCSGGSFGGSVYDPGNSTIYAACSGGLRALTLGSGSPPSISSKAGFSAPSGATGPPMIAGGLVWVTNHSSGSLYGLSPSSGATRSKFSIPEQGTEVNHFATASAGGGLLFVGSGDQVSAFRIASPPAPSQTTTALVASANPAPAGTAVRLTASIAPIPDAGSVTFTDGGAPISSCAGVAESGGRAVCTAVFTRLGTHQLAAAYAGDSFYAGSRSAVLTETVVTGVPSLSRLRVRPHRVSIAHQRFRLKISYRLSAAASVVLTFKHRVHGRWVTMRGHITLRGKSGANAFTFRGKLGRRRLGRGSYELIATVTSHGIRGAPHTARFTVVG